MVRSGALGEAWSGSEDSDSTEASWGGRARVGVGWRRGAGGGSEEGEEGKEGEDGAPVAQAADPRPHVLVGRPQ